MANPPPNVGQSYFWGTGVSQPQNMGYYSVPPPNFPPPNFSQPPPSYNIPVSTLPNANSGGEKSTHLIVYTIGILGSAGLIGPLIASSYAA